MDCKDCEWWDDGCMLPDWDECENRPPAHDNCQSCKLQSICKKTKKMNNETLSALSENKNSDIRREIASNPYTPYEILLKLAHDKNCMVRMSVAQNINITVDILQKLSTDMYEGVRFYVAQNSKTPSDMLARMARNKSFAVRDNIITNPNTSIETLQFLTRCRDNRINTAAKEMLSKRMTNNI